MDYSAYPVTILLIAINVLFSLGGFSSQNFMEKTILWPYAIKRENQYYRMITSGFLHADYMHLFFNMFTLFFFGRNVEMIFAIYGLGGKIAYVLLYLTSLVASDLPTYLKQKDNYHYRALGASGAVSAIVFSAIVFDPWSAIYLFGAIKISALVYAVLFIWYCIYMGKQNSDNVNHDAHLWGALYGLVFTVILIGAMRPELFPAIIEQLKEPSLFGH